MKTLEKITIQRAINLFKGYFSIKYFFKVKYKKFKKPKSKEISVFIVGCERSGTTLMEIILDNHSNMAICPETHFWMDGINKKLEKILNKNKFKNNQLDEIKEFVDGFRDFSDQWYEYGLTPSNYIELKNISNKNSLLIYRMIIEGQAKIRGKKIFGEKTPGHVFFINNIIKMYPNTKIIQMIRDPRDVTLSRLYKKGEYSKNILDKIVNGFFVNIEWNLSSKLARFYKEKLKDNFLLISFEELLENPEEIIEQICNFLDVDFEEKMLDINVINSSFLNESKGFSKTSKNRWKKNLPFWLDLIVKSVNSREMELMGYKK